MKKKYIKIQSLGAVLMGMAMLSSCDYVLDEQPRSSYDPSFFKTQTGIEGGLTALYSSLRDLYGQAYYFNACETGTDEYTYAQSADGNFKAADLTGLEPLNSTSCRADALWGMAYTYINTASGVIENGEAAGASEALLAEAHFFRAYYYFQLVQTFGGVPLDLGSGNLKFNQKPVRVSKRNTVPEVYDAIFNDLKIAVEKLPDNPRLTGAVTKNVARLVLAKADLTYGWWLKNPKDIPTYPEAARTGDPASYFQAAYDLSVEAIDHPGPYALQPTYYDVTRATNDRNSECMLWADHTEASEFYNGGSLTYGGGGAPDNFASWMGCWNYTNLQCKDASGNKFNPVQRECVQLLGRPWTRMAPPIDVFTKQFADKTNDSRYDGTFTSRFHANYNLNGNDKDKKALCANGMEVKPGEVVLSFLDDDSQAVTYPSGAGENNVGAGTLPGRADYVIAPEGISRLTYPMLYKQGPYRTDNNGTFGQPNAGSTRPFNILKFSEFYFIAAEAAVMGANTQNGKTAKDLINVIRARAGKWVFDVNDNVAKVEDHSEEMVAATPDNITIEYILDERMREYFGEGYRWFDLVRTQNWKEMAGTYRICGSDAGDHTAKTFTREITKEMYLRPIPQGQLDGMEMTAEERDAYQNPAYRSK